MQVQLKAVLLVALLACYEAERVKHHVDIGILINRVTDLDVSTGTEPGVGGFACDRDVMVQAWSGDKKLADIRVQKSAMAVPGDPAAPGRQPGVEVGRKTAANGCDVVYSLLCERGLTTLRKEVAGCKANGEIPGEPQRSGRKDRHFGFWKLWRTTSQHARQSLFTFSASFLNEQYAATALEATKVHFTPTKQTCADVRTKAAAAQPQLDEGLLRLTPENFQAHIARLKTYAKAKMGYDKIGCDSTPIMDVDSKDEMVIQLRKTFTNVQQPGVGKETARQRFDDTLEFVEDHPTDISLSDIIEACGIALGREVETGTHLEIAGGIEELSPEAENIITEQFTAMVPFQKGQVSISGGAVDVAEPSSNSTALVQLQRMHPLGYFLIIYLVTVLLVLFWYVTLGLFIAGCILAAGLGTYTAVTKYKRHRRGASHVPKNSLHES